MPRRWFAADFEVTPDGRFLQGSLGYSEERTDVQFDDETWSWYKGVEERRDTGSDDTIVPFAIDLDEGERWVAFALAPRMRWNQFRSGLQRVLQRAVVDAGLVGYEWEVDLVTSKSEIRRWLQENPYVYELTRVVRFSNPGSELDEDEAEMVSLGARRKTEQFRAHPRGTLEVHSPTFDQKIDGTESGFVEVMMKARGATPRSEPRFNSTLQHDRVVVAGVRTRAELAAEVLRNLAARVGVLRSRETGK